MKYNIVRLKAEVLVKNMMLIFIKIIAKMLYHCHMRRERENERMMMFENGTVSSAYMHNIHVYLQH
jgi:hypothetical protein